MWVVVLLDKNNSIGFVTILGQIDPLDTGYMPTNVTQPLASFNQMTAMQMHFATYNLGNML